MAEAAGARPLGVAPSGATEILDRGRPPLTADQIITNILIGHIDQHFGSIRQTIAG